MVRPADFKIQNLLPLSLSFSLRVILVVTKLFLEVHPLTPDVVEVLKNFYQILRYFMPKKHDRISNFWNGRQIICKSPLGTLPTLTFKLLTDDVTPGGRD